MVKMRHWTVNGQTAVVILTDPKITSLRQLIVQYVDDVQDSLCLGWQFTLDHYTRSGKWWRCDIAHLKSGTSYKFSRFFGCPR